MSLFERPDYRWRETYFVLFQSQRRPSLARVQQAIHEVNRRCEFSNAVVDEHGLIESLTVISPEDHAAIDISYSDGEEAMEEAVNLYEELRPSIQEPEEKAKLERLKTLDAKLDLLHFEQAGEGADGEDDEMLNPATLLGVIETLTKLTRGVGVDPQSGTLF